MILEKLRKKNHQIRSLEEGEKLVTSFNPRLKKEITCSSWTGEEEERPEQVISLINLGLKLLIYFSPSYGLQIWWFFSKSF
jgi:hypothetical protein